jgi:hypothetical protein
MRLKQNSLFNMVAGALSFIGTKTGFTYNEINIIVYFFVIPFSWFCLLDVIFNFHFLKAGSLLFFIGFFTGCRDFKAYSDWLFDKSVNFLNYFNRFGSNYFTTSVWICVTLPVAIYIFLFYLILR